MPQKDVSHGDQSVSNMMTGFLSAEELQRMADQHDVEKVLEKGAVTQREEEERKKKMKLLAERRPLTPEIVNRAIDRWTAAAKGGATEVEILRFPSELCTDDGRAINNAESGWGQTLVGVPAQVYEIWFEHLRPLGFRLKAYIVDFPHDRPGDVGMFISWR